MKHIKQQGWADCGVACIAMVCDVDYFRVLSSVPPDVYFYGLWYDEIRHALWKITEEAWAIKHFSVQQFPIKELKLEIKPQILGVRCNTLKDLTYYWQFHFISSDGIRIFDPREEKEILLEDFNKSERGNWKVEAIIFK